MSTDSLTVERLLPFNFLMDVLQKIISLNALESIFMQAFQLALPFRQEFMYLVYNEVLPPVTKFVETILPNNDAKWRALNINLSSFTFAIMLSKSFESCSILSSFTETLYFNEFQVNPNHSTFCDGDQQLFSSAIRKPDLIISSRMIAPILNASFRDDAKAIPSSKYIRTFRPCFRQCLVRIEHTLVNI